MYDMKAMGHLGIESQNNILPNYYPFFILKVTFGIFFHHRAWFTKIHFRVA